MEGLHWILHFLKIKSMCFIEEEEQSEKEIAKDKKKMHTLKK